MVPGTSPGVRILQGHVGPGGPSGSSRPAGVALAVAVASVPLGIYGEWAFSRTGATLPTVLYDLSVGWAFVAAGVVASRRGPTVGAGLLMALEGLTWFLTDLEGSGISAVVFVGVVLGAINEAVLAHLVLTFPTGRTSSRVEVGVILTAYAASVIGGLSYLDTGGPAYDIYRCQGCTTGVVLLSGHTGALHAAQHASEAAATLVGLVVIGLVILRYARCTVAERRLLTPLWLSLGIFVLLTASHLLAVFEVPLGEVRQSYIGTADIVQLAVPFAFLAVVLRLRLTRAAVGEAVLELGPGMSFDGLRAALARAVGDPSLEVGIWDPGSRIYRDPAGRAVELPGPGDARTARLVEHAGDPAVIVLYDRALASDPRLPETIASALRMGAERGSILRQLRGNLDELRASRARIAEAGDAARRQLERDLHDGAQQRFVVLSMTLASTLRELGERPEASELRATLARATQEVREGLAELRELARGIHPALVTDRGLADAIDSLVARMPIPVEVATAPDRFPPPVEMTAYYVVCEALTNVTRHAGASSAHVSVRREPGALVVEVVDDGSGGARPETGSGLRGIADRVAALDGTLSIESPDGGGTRIRAVLPCA